MIHSICRFLISHWRPLAALVGLVVLIWFASSANVGGPRGRFDR
jgi:hypothetical protein